MGDGIAVAFVRAWASSTTFEISTPLAWREHSLAHCIGVVCDVRNTARPHAPMEVSDFIAMRSNLWEDIDGGKPTRVIACHQQGAPEH